MRCWNADILRSEERLAVGREKNSRRIKAVVAEHVAAAAVVQQQQ